MKNLKLPNAAQRRFVFVECYTVNCFHALRDFLKRSLCLWIIHGQLIRACLLFSRSQQICISYWNYKIRWKATTICLFSIFYNLMSNGIQVPSKFLWQTKFFPTSWSAVFIVKCDEGRFSNSMFTSWRKPQRWCYTRRFATTIFSLFSTATLLQHCFEELQHCSNIATLCCAKNHHCELSHVISP